MGICYIVGAGECTEIPKIQKEDFVIAADGGYDTLRRAGITPNLLIGDLDSIDKLPNDIEILRHKVRKDETDMHLAYIEASKRGYNSFLLFGGTGGRADHTFANYSLLLYIREHGGFAKLIGDEADSFVIKNEKYEFSTDAGKHFSVFAFGGKALGVTIEGASYNAQNIDLSPDFPLGVSNVFLDTPVKVSVKNGALLIILEK